MKYNLKAAIELLDSENEEDVILATIILGKIGRENIRHLFAVEIGDFVGYRREFKGTTIWEVKIISSGDCRFWLGGNSLNLLDDSYDPEKDEGMHLSFEYLDYE